MVGSAPEDHLPPSEEAHDVDPERRTYQRASLRGPAVIVLGIAVGIVVLGVVASALDSGSSPTVTLPSVTLTDGTTVPLTPARTAMRSIVDAGQPPADIIGNLVVPAQSTVVRTINSDGGVEQFDRTVAFTTTLSQSRVVATFRAALPKMGWSITYAGPGSGRTDVGTEVLAKRGSGDGFYWEVGVVASPTTSARTTPYSVEVFELPDED